MQAFEDGRIIQSKYGSGSWCERVDPVWNWKGFNYRIKPETVEEAAKEYYKFMAWVSRDPNETFIDGAEFGAEWQKQQGDSDE